ncbi:MAG: hypothetical protein AB8G05_01350 [Oligoflexales bacterium]
MLDIEVTIDINEIKDMVEKRQVPYALSRTLTDLGKEATKANIRHAKDEYTIRRPWVLKGFQYTIARKNLLKTIVKHRDTYMSKHERGDKVRSQRSKFIAVPQENRGRSVRASVALRDPRTFFQGKSIIKRKPRSRQYLLLFKLSDDAQYAPTLMMEKIVQAVIDEKADSLFNKHWLAAIDNVY